MGISILDDEDIVMNSMSFPYIKLQAQNISEKISFKVFKKFTEKLYKGKNNEVWYISCSEFPGSKYEDITDVGNEMATAIQPQDMGATCIDCRFFNATGVLSQILQSKDEQLIILSEPSKMAPKEYHELMMIFKEWQDSEEINVDILKKNGISDLSTSDISTLKAEHTFIFLEKNKFPDSEILNISVDFYGDFFIDYNSFECMRMLEKMILED